MNLMKEKCSQNKSKFAIGNFDRTVQQYMVVLVVLIKPMLEQHKMLLN